MRCPICSNRAEVVIRDTRGEGPRMKRRRFIKTIRQLLQREYESWDLADHMVTAHGWVPQGTWSR